MEELFVNREISLKLKDVEFNEPCLGLYLDNVLYFGLNDKMANFSKYYPLINSNLSHYASAAPTWDQIIEWFVEKYNIWTVVDTSLIEFYEGEKLLPPKFQYVIENLINRDSDYLYHSADDNLFYSDHKEARLDAVLKTIEIIKNKR